MAKIKKCEWCGREFEYQRSTARFCSSQCRLKSHKWRKHEGVAPEPEVRVPPDPGLGFPCPSRDGAAQAATRIRLDAGYLLAVEKQGPLDIRGRCGRAARSIVAALNREGM